MPSGSSGAPGVARYTTTQRRLLALSAGVGVAVLAGVLFVLSYDDLRALALAGRAAERFASAYPVMYDALVAVTILSLVVARRARWWSRWTRWLLLLVLVGGAAAASAQRALKGYEPLPDQTLAAGVAVAPHVMLVIAVWLWLTMFRQARAAPAGRTSRPTPRAPAAAEPETQPETQPETRPEARTEAGSQSKVEAWSEPEAEPAARPAATRPATGDVAGKAPAYDPHPAEDLVPGMAEADRPSPRRKGSARRRPGAGQPLEMRGIEPWLDAGEPRAGSAEPGPVAAGPMEAGPVHTDPADAHSAHAEPTAAEPAAAQPTQPAPAQPPHAQPAAAESAAAEPISAQPVTAEPVEPGAGEPISARPAAPEPIVADAGGTDAGAADPRVPETPAGIPVGKAASGASKPARDTDPELGVVHEQEPPRTAPSSLPTDVKLVGRSPVRPAATTLPDGILVDVPDPAEDDIDASVADRAEDPDAGDDEPEGPHGRHDLGFTHDAAGGSVQDAEHRSRSGSESDEGNDGNDDVERWSVAAAEDVQRWASDAAGALTHDEPMSDSDSAAGGEWPPSSKFRSSPTPPTD